MSDNLLPISTWKKRIDNSTQHHNGHKTQSTVIIMKMSSIHRYRPEIPEPAPSLSWGANWKYSGFSRDQNNCD